MMWYENNEEDRLASVNWSALAAPGDEIAHGLFNVLGPAKSLSWVRSTLDDPTGASSDLGESIPRDLLDRALGSIERWRQGSEGLDAAAHLERADKIGARVVMRGDPEWPIEIDDLGTSAPFCLWVRGVADIGEAWARSVAIVGSKSCTEYGSDLASDLSAGLSESGFSVISSGAYGIDARAHSGVFRESGTTVAVMACGVDILYPSGNAGLLTSVMNSGAIVSEVPPGYAPHWSRFLSRNRVIATAGATVVVEAASRSGALSTATHAAALGRPVAAVPGPESSMHSRGTNRLIAGGATPVTSARDVIEMMEPFENRETERPSMIDDLPVHGLGTTAQL